MTVTRKRVPIRKGEFGVRFASDRDHKRHGWIFKDCVSVNAAVRAADYYLAENGYVCVMLAVIDHTGAEVESVARDE